MMAEEVFVHVIEILVCPSEGERAFAAEEFLERLTCTARILAEKPQR